MGIIMMAFGLLIGACIVLATLFAAFGPHGPNFSPLDLDSHQCDTWREEGDSETEIEFMCYTHGLIYDRR